MTTPFRAAVALRAAAVGALVVALDQLTKAWVVRRLEPVPCSTDPDVCIDLIGSLRFHFVENPGVAFSIGDDWSLGPVLTIVGLVLAAVLVVVAGRTEGRILPLVMGAVAGGAVGNVVDRITRAEDGFGTGTVVDFIDLQWYPVFNVADIAIVCGIAVVVLAGMRTPAEEAKAVPDGGAAGDSTDDPSVDGEPVTES